MMKPISIWKQELADGVHTARLASLYCCAPEQTPAQAARYEAVLNGLEATFGTHAEAGLYSAPGRTEIGGNHTDHQHGRVLAGSVNIDMIAAAAPNSLNQLRVQSEGYDLCVIDLSNLAVRKEEENTTMALLRGECEAFRQRGAKLSGLDVYISSNVPKGSGVSSSAAFEVLIGVILNDCFMTKKVSPIEIAQIGQWAENVYFGKPCGLMDQMACAAGGPILLDFSDKENISCEKIAFSFEDMGCRLVIVNTGKGHADLSEEYSSIPMEMREAAKAMGVELLCESSMENLLAHVKDIPNDRAVLRAMHFYEENRRVADAVKAVENKDGEGFLHLLEESGNSSWEWLQNCYSLQNCKEQKITLSLALTKLFLNKIGAGICRVHGGGFAGVIMCVLPIENADAYVDYMAQYVGRENVYPMNIRSTGAVHVE